MNEPSARARPVQIVVSVGALQVARQLIEIYATSIGPSCWALAQVGTCGERRGATRADVCPADGDVAGGAAKSIS